MDSFSLYFQIGMAHITDLKGYDHMLFLAALCSPFALFEWRKVAILVTAFTVGHAVTLVVSTLAKPLFQSDLIEFLIPVTILFTALSNLAPKRSGRSMYVLFAMVLIFGLIHGMGFSNYLRGLLGGGDELIGPLFSFNVGVEVGQLLIVGIAMIVLGLLSAVFNLQRRDMNIFISGCVSGLAMLMIIEKWPF